MLTVRANDLEKCLVNDPCANGTEHKLLMVVATTPPSFNTPVSAKKPAFKTDPVLSTGASIPEAKPELEIFTTALKFALFDTSS